MKNFRKLATVLMILAVIFTFASCRNAVEFPKEPNNIPEADESNRIINNTRLGNPSWKLDQPKEESFIISRDSYVLSYNNIKHTPNWVSWHLTKEDFKDSGRTGSFREDPLLPPEWEHVLADDYEKGFHRGHMCPNGDRNAYQYTDTPELQTDTFYMTNMIPQTGSNNSGVWNDFEMFIRQEYVKKGYEAYIVCGPAGVGSIQNDGTVITEIGKRDEVRITVPAYTWKVVVFIPEGTDDLNRISEDTITLAIWMPNDQSLQQDMNQYVTTVDFVEQQTGFDFFANVPNSIEDKIEAKTHPNISYVNPF